MYTAPFYLQYLCAYQPVYRDVETPYWDLNGAVYAAGQLLSSGRKVVRVLDSNGNLAGEYTQPGTPNGYVSDEGWGTGPGGVWA